MPAWKTLFVVSLVVAWSSPSFTQDPLKVDPTHYKVLHETASVRILKIDYAPGGKSVMHQHPDSIVVPLAASKVQFTLPGGKVESQDLAAEGAMYTPAGTHSPTNVGTTRVDAILVEFKGATPGKATLPAARPGLAMKVLADGPRAMAYRTTADAKFSEAAGTTHDYDQVVIALSAASGVSLVVDGKPARTQWARGDVQFIPRGAPHEARNTGGKPVDFVIVAIR
jgi:quercetin dioxygenase-like cupin family protein